jgi:hypothetical protein
LQEDTTPTNQEQKMIGFMKIQDHIKENLKYAKNLGNSIIVVVVVVVVVVSMIIIIVIVIIDITITITITITI